MPLDSHLDRAHAHLAEAMFSLVRATEDEAVVEGEKIRAIAGLILEAQAILMDLTRSRGVTGPYHRDDRLH